MSPYEFPVEVRYIEPVPGAVVRRVGRQYAGGKPGRKMPSPRPDPTKCMSGRHDWIPENIVDRGPGHREGMQCRRCKNERSARRNARARAADPIAAAMPGRAPERRSAAVAEEYTELRALGYSFNEAALHMGMKRVALSRSLRRSGTPT